MPQTSVLLVTADDVGYVDCRAELTPVLQGLRTSPGAVDFRQAYGMPVCSQSRACSFYGALGRELGTVHDLGPTGDPASAPTTPQVEPGWPTLASVMRTAGYRTCLVGKWHLGWSPSGAPWPAAPIEQGFEEWRAGTAHNVQSFRAWERVDSDWLGWAISTETRYATLAQVEEASSFWLAHLGEPVFLQVALNEPHIPLDRPPAELLAGLELPELPRPREAYEAKIRAADTALGRLLALPGMDQALVIFWGDNGTSVRGPGQDRDKLKGTVFDGGIHVPMVARAPQFVGAPGVSDGLRHVVDIPAAVLEVCGLTRPAAWTGQTTTRSHVICEAWRSELKGLIQCVRTPTHKLMNAGGVELFFDLVADPTESSPLDTSGGGALLAGLRAKLYSWSE